MPCWAKARRLLWPERGEQPIDVARRLSLAETKAGKLHQPALLLAHAARQVRARRSLDVADIDIVGRGLAAQCGKRVWHPAPDRRLAFERKEIDASLRGDVLQEGDDLRCGEACGDIAAPDRYVEIRMTATAEARDMTAIAALAHQRQDEHRRIVAVHSRDDQRLAAGSAADMRKPVG